MKIEDTLNERGKRYGEFSEHARITQALKYNMIDSPNWAALSTDKREALEMIAHKIGRILNGDPEYADSWHDIVGYAQLVENNLNAKTSKTYPFVKSDTKFKIGDLVYIKCLSGTITGSIKDAGEDGSCAVKIVSSYTNAPLKPNEIYYCMAQDLKLISHEETKSSCI